MEGALKLWAVIIAVGALNYFSRLSFIALLGRRSMPPAIARALRYVPAAMLTALILPMVVDPSGGAVSMPRILAAIAASVVAFFRWGTLWTLGVGMVVLWLLLFAL